MRGVASFSLVFNVLYSSKRALNCELGLFCTAILVVIYFIFLVDDEIMLLSTGELVNGVAVKDFVLLLLCISVSFIFSPDIFVISSPVIV